MATDMEFDDPIVEQDHNRVIWAIRTTFAVVFYRHDDEVSVFDYFVVGATANAFAVAFFVSNFAFMWATNGYSSAVNTWSAGFAGVTSPDQILSAIGVFLLAAPLLMIIVAWYKAVRGDRR